MTVCVAVISQRNRIICASDRMLTILGMQFEPPTSKMYYESRGGCAFLYATEDAGLSDEVISHTIAALAQRPTKYRVEEAAEAYALAYRRAADRRIEAGALGKFGVRLADLRAPGTLPPEMRSKALRLIDQYKVPETECIIAGVNPSGGAELWTARNGEVTPANVPAFAVIGGGYDHAYSELMCRGCHLDIEPAHALFLAYKAKRRADEIVTGVGKNTDMCIIGPRPGDFVPPQPWFQMMGGLYDELRQTERRGFEDAVAKTTAMFNATWPATPPPSLSPPPAPESPPAPTHDP
jgi:hypothetical protein